MTEMSVQDFVIEAGVLVKYQGPGGRVVIPEGVTAVGDEAFFQHTTLTEVRFHRNITEIGAWSFFGCTGLTRLEIPGSVKAIGDNAFAWCAGLREAVLEEGVEELGVQAFCKCKSLKKLVLPESLQKMGCNALAGCNELVVCVTVDSYALVETKRLGIRVKKNKERAAEETGMFCTDYQRDPKICRSKF